MQTAKSTLTKAHLMELLCEQIGLNRRESKDMVDAFFDLICSSVARGEGAEAHNLGPPPASVASGAGGEGSGEEATGSSGGPVAGRAAPTTPAASTWRGPSESVDRGALPSWSP